MKGSFEKELEVAARLAREAGELILEVASLPSFRVEEKPEEGGPVTEADLLANEHIVRGLREAFPDDGVVAEESDGDGDGRSRCWYVDPLDGTKEFLRGNGQFAVHIGLAVEGEARVGIVYRPVGRRLYAGVVGRGCTLEEGGTTRRLVAPRADPSSLRLALSLSHPSRRIEEVREGLGVREVVRSGSVGLKCAMVAEGAADLYVHASRKSYRWDACAPEAVVRGAGGVFLDMAGEPYRYGEGELQNLRGILVCGESLLPSVLPVVREAGRAAGLLG